MQSTIKESLSKIREMVHPEKTPENKLVALIIGAGNMGKLMTKVLKDNGHDVVGIISEKGENAKKLTQDYKKDDILAGKWDERDTIWEALSHGQNKINFIVLAVPPNKIFECGQWSLGKSHTFTRGNPINRVEVEKLRKLADTSGYLFLGRSERLFSPVHLKAKDLLKVNGNGEILEKKDGAKVISIESNFSLIPEAPWYLSQKESGDITIAHSIFDMQVVADLISDPTSNKSLLPTFAFATGELREKNNPDSVLNFCKATLYWNDITYTAMTSYFPPLDPAKPRYINILFSDGKELLITHETNKPGGSLKWIKNEGNKQKVEEVKIEGVDQDPFILQFEEAAKLIYSLKKLKEKESPIKTSPEKQDKPSSRCLFANAERDIMLMEEIRKSVRTPGVQKILTFNVKATRSLSETENALSKQSFLSHDHPEIDQAAQEGNNLNNNRNRSFSSSST